MTEIQTILDAVVTSVAVLDTDGRIQKLNERCAWCLDSAPRHARGQPFWDLLPVHGSNSAVASAFAAFHAGQFPVSFECDLTATGHSVRHVAWTLARTPALDYVVATGVDITEQHHRLAALRAREEQLSTLVDNMPDAVFLKDGEGRWLKANAAALSLYELEGTGYHGETEAELSANSEFYRDPLRVSIATDEHAWANHALTREQEVIPQRDGTTRVIDAYKVPLFHADGTRKALVVLGRDISERVWAEVALRKSEDTLRRVLETAPEIIGLIDATGCFQYINPAVEHLTGVSRNLIIGRNFIGSGWTITTPDGDPISMDQHPFVRARMTPVSGIELACQGPGGPRRVFSFNATPLDVPPGSVVFAASDVTRRNEIERMKSDFIRIASHELRTPLTPLRLLVERARTRAELGQPIDPTLFVSVQRHLDRMVSLVDEMLDLMRLEHGLLYVRRQSVDLRDEIRRVVEDVRLGVPERRITLVLPDLRAPARIDPSGIAHVLRNLLDNAIKYSSQEITVTLALEADWLRVTVADRGPGVRLERQPDLFTRFSRAGNEASSPSSGLGLGLYVCRLLISRHGGEVGFTSGQHGSQFFFRLQRDSLGELTRR